MNTSNGTPLDTYARRIEELEREVGILNREKEDYEKMLAVKRRHVDTLATMVERLERIETAAKAIEWLKRGECSDDPWYETDCVAEVDALKDALGANDDRQ